MDIEVSPAPFEESLQTVEEPFASKSNENGGDEEEEVFYDAGEEVTDNSSDIIPPDIKFSVAHEDLPTDSSDRSEVDAFDSPIRPKTVRAVPLFGNLDDISTEVSSSVEENGSPQFRKTLLSDADDVTVRNSQQPLTFGKNSKTENSTADVASCPIEKKEIDESNNHENDNENESLKNYVIEINSSQSALEVMDDGSDCGFVGNSTVIGPQAMSESFAKNLNADANGDEIVENSLVSNSVGNFGERPNENIGESCESITPVNFEKSEAAEKTADAGEILTMDDDSDVDESFQENLHVALKVVEENSLLSPTNTDSRIEETDSQKKTDEDTNKIESVAQPVKTSSKAENILRDICNDSEQLNNSNIETIEDRQCPCKVVLFKIDFDKNVLQSHRNGAGISQSPIVSAAESDSDNSFSRSVKTPTQLRKLRPKRPRSLTKSIRKNRMSSSESELEVLSFSTRSSRVVSLTSKSSPFVKDRSQRKLNKATNSVCVKSTHINTSSSDSDDVPLTQLRSIRKRKLASNDDRVSASKGKKLSKKSSEVEKIDEKPSQAKRHIALVDDEIKTNSKKNRCGQVSRHKILKCVSLPIITGIVKSLKENSYQELLELMATKASKLSLPTESVSKSDVNLPVGRRSRRRKLSSSDLSESSADDSDYKVYSKLWKHNSGSSKKQNTPSLRETLKSSPAKKSLREKTKALCYTEDSASNSEVEISLKTKKPFRHVKRNPKKGADNNDAEVEQSSNKIDNRYPRRNAQLRSRTRV